MKNEVIRVEGLSKRYKLGTIGYGSLQNDFLSWWARFRGKEDPNAAIGSASRVGLYGDFWALRDISFSLAQGDRLGIVGRNGAGKSTLLKLLSRITTPTTGTIRYRGRVASLLEVGTGFHPELTGRENVYLNGAILGMNRREIQSKFDEIVDFSGVKDFIDTPVKRYSSGMYVRLAFSVAAHLDADIMVIDEVLAVGDAEFQKKCITKMEEISKSQGRTILFVSHSITSVAKLCTKGLLLNEGRLVYAGEASETLSRYAELFPLVKDGRVAVNDEYHVRSSGHLEIEKLQIEPHSEKVPIEIGSRVAIEFAIKVKEPVKNLGLILAVKDRFLPSFATNVVHPIPEDHLESGKLIQGKLVIDTTSFRPGLYPLYFWAGDLMQRSAQGCPMVVADEVIGPLNLIKGSNHTYQYGPEDDALVFSVESELEIKVGD